MLVSAAREYRHPRTRGALILDVDHADGEQILSGTLAGGGDRIPIVRGIPRFCALANYASTFGYQWTAFATTQLDSRAGWRNVSEKRLFAETGWPPRMDGERLLEAGSGMGRFTEVLARSGAEVFTFDASVAVEVNAEHNGRFRNVHFAQADIHAPPYEWGSFDRVLCIGVLQHCPAPGKAFQALTPFLKPGGEIVIDVYRLSWRSLFLGKYYLRPLTRRLRPEALHRLVKAHVGWAYPLTGSIQTLAGSLGRKVSAVLALADYRGVYDAPDATLRALTELDTFDMLSPTYDRPQTLAEVRRWFRDAALIDVTVKPGRNGIEARGRRA
jgi:2-polyprenyl-3-methyl-5-hydroxy-6-metoxy-1,4-benzoquinol methylase